MALTKSQLNNEILSPVRDMEVMQIAPLVREGSLGKYVFLFDYKTDIYTPEAIQIMTDSGAGKSYTLPKGSFYTLKYSKGDVVDVVDFKRYNNEKGIPVVDKNVMVINVPKYVKPIGGNQGFSPTLTVDNTLLKWLQKVPDTTPVTEKLGVNYGANINPVTLPVLDNPTPTPVVTNGVEDATEKPSFFQDKNNLLIIAGVLLVGYLLFSDKSE